MRFTLILFEEHPASKKLKRDGVTALHVWGSLFFSGAYTLQERLDKTRAFETIPRQDLFPATAAFGEFNLRAIRAAEMWPAETNHGLT
ncbi:MAG: hypothetical protein GXP42_04050 [Chloroflexi bacterium]|nr:hypothetical protein [Chloroflexota bacterium]